MSSNPSSTRERAEHFRQLIIRFLVVDSETNTLAFELEVSG